MEIRELNKNEFPSQLLEIPQPPKRLWIKGTFPEKGSIFLTIVGSRKCTTYGQDVVKELIAKLKGYNIILVSGLAIGIDTLVHENALKNDLITIAFPGSGIDDDFLYPHQNLQLSKKIIQAGGCLISEYEPKQTSMPWTFPARNRLMAGMSKATLLIEATEKSGTLITARMALDYNRDVLAVPGSIYSPSSFGTNELIKQGAIPVTCGEDVLKALGFSVEESNDTTRSELIKSCTKEERALLDFISQPLDKDELIQISKMESYIVFSLLSMLELKGLIKEDNGTIRRV